ncbi:hypothetical protein [Pseudomonas sp.]|uniref:hypothetical protein n=1 Tax=Pseudomonas sp. TaxID=306 RepID=UPI003BB7AB25
MKSILGMTALAALMMGAAVTTVQAEGSSGRQLEALVSDRASRDSAERFSQLIAERPTAAGNAIVQQERRIEKSEPEILRDRVLYGSSRNQGSSQHVVRTLEEQPAAAGPAQRAERSEPDILRHRVLYGSSSNQGSSQRFVRMLEEQPAAAGPAQRAERSEPDILRQRVLYRPL